MQVYVFICKSWEYCKSWSPVVVRSHCLRFLLGRLTSLSARPLQKFDTAYSFLWNLGASFGGISAGQTNFSSCSHRSRRSIASA